MTTLPADDRKIVRYEGDTPGTEIWGMTQANFLVALPGYHAKETAIHLTDAAAAKLATALGTENTPEFRKMAAEEAGMAILQPLAAEGDHIDSIYVVSEATIEDHPGILERLQSTPAVA